MWGKLILTNLALLLYTLVCPSAPNAQSSEALLEQGLRLFAQGQFSAAVALFNQYKQTNPQDARPYFYAGLAMTEAGRLTAAALEVGEAVRLDPQHPEYLVLQANVFARLKQKPYVDDTLAIFQQAGAVERLDARWLWLLVDAYFRVERFDDTLRALDVMGKRFPDDPRLDLNRGQVYALQGQFDLALKSLRKSVAKYPDNPLAHYELGKLLYRRGDLPASKKALLEAVRLEKNNAEYLRKLGAVLLALNEIDEATVRFQQAAALDPQDPQIYLSLGQAYQRKGEREKALEFRKKYQEMSVAKKQKETQVDEVDRLLARGERLLDEANDAEARVAFEQAVHADPNNWTAHGYLAEMFLGAEDWRKAWPHLAKMEELDAESVVGNYLMARYWHLRQEFEKARGFAEKVKQSRPAHAELRNLLGKIYLGLGEREPAISEFEEAVRLAPDRADFRENLHKLKPTR